MKIRRAVFLDRDGTIIDKEQGEYITHIEDVTIFPYSAEAIKLLNKDFKDQALEGLQRVLEERVFHAECNGRYPYVIEQKHLDRLVDSAAEQLNLHTPEGAQTFFSSEHKTATIYLDIPER